METLKIENLNLKIVKNSFQYIACKIQGNQNVNFRGFTIKPKHIVIIDKICLSKIDSIFTFAVWIDEPMNNTYSYFQFNEDRFEEESICWGYSEYWELLDDLYNDMVKSK